MTLQVDHQPLVEVARMTDPAFYATQPWDVWARLRREAPVFWYEPAELWVVSTYDDIRYVGCHPDLFSSMYGLVPSDIPVDDGAELEDTGMPRRAELRRKLIMGHFGPGSEALLMSDPPRHTELRKVINFAFSPRIVASLHEGITERVNRTIDAIEPGTVADLVQTVSLPIPMGVMGEMVGLPDEDLPMFTRCMDALVATIDSLGQEQSSDEMADFYTQLTELAMYFFGALADRRENPREDLLTALTRATLDGEPLSDLNQLTMITHLLLGGNETTRNLISASVKLLAQHPDQRQVLIDHPELINQAIEECLRFASPVISQCRTALADTEIGGVPVRRGDYLELLYASANRDETVWPDADVFDVTRKPDPMHLAFGFGEHFCVGAALARTQARKVLERLLVRFPNWELAGEVRYLPSTLANAIDSMPVRFA